MLTVKIVDGLFPQSHSFGYGGDNCDLAPRLLRWDRSAPTGQDLVVFTDSHLREHQRYPAQKRVALLIESPAVRPGIYDWIQAHAGEFDTVLTHSRDLADQGEPFTWYPLGGCWVHRDWWGLQAKPLSCSILLSAKTGQQGHRLRHEAAKLAGVDAYGAGVGHHLPSKVPALQPYQFSIIIENTRAHGYFSEKLIDCLLTWTVPIYWGAPDIGRYFRGGGLIEFETLDELASILPRLDEGQYWRRFDAMVKNHTLAEQYSCPEDWLARVKPEVLQL